MRSLVLTVAGVIVLLAGAGGEGAAGESVELEGELMRPKLEVAPVDDVGEREGGEPRDSSNVIIRDFQFDPDTITVTAGDTVEWENEDDGVVHTATADDGDFDTGDIGPNESASATLPTAGTFQYHCIPHPSMKGTVRVEKRNDNGVGPGSDGNANDDDDGGTNASAGETESDGSTTSGSGSAFPSGGSSSGGYTGAPAASGGGGSLPNTGQPALPLLILGSALIVLGLLGRAFHEYWIWR